MNLGNRSRRLAGVAIGGTAIAVSLATLPSQAAVQSASAPTSVGSAARGTAVQRTPGNIDVRQLSARASVLADRDRLRGQSRGDLAFTRSLGTQALVDMDPLTGTPRNVGRLDGFLSAPSAKPARTAALDYVRAHLASLGLSAADLSTLRFSRDYVDSFGVHNLAWTQSVGGAEVFGNGLKVKVTRAGQVLAVQGSPVAGLAKLAAAAPSGTSVSADAARDAAAGDVGGRASDVRSSSSSATTTWANNDYATKVWFLTPSGLRPAWSTYVSTGSDGAYQHVVDATSGDVLFRRSTVDSEKGDAKVYDNYPGAARGGQAKVVNLVKKGWLKRSRSFLNGSSVVAWSDVDDDNQLSESEKTPVPGTKGYPQFGLKPFDSSGFCSPKFVCTWDPETPFSWKKNRKADVTQAFYLASNFHDYLKNGPAKFTAAAGNFSADGGDPVLLNALDGASTNEGLPDGNHIDNANMNTPPDGTPPTMQMYLWHSPGTTDAEDPFVPTSSAFDASVEYHEYIHGLSNRLVVDADGNSTLNSIQAGSMGEAWSDFYAMDYLVNRGFVKDTAKDAEVLEGNYLVGGRAPFRTEAIDCPVSSTAAKCTAIDGTTTGGYTYGDFPRVTGSPEVHSSGEVWSQTLWDLRNALGHGTSVKLITRAMSLSADNPSFLDMRNAILQADLAGYDGSHSADIWKVFAKRGMGYFAGAISGDDAAPAEDFHRPPAPYTARQSIAGTVTDPTTGNPVSGAVVTVTGQGDRFSDVTNADGQYSIGGLFKGTYQKVAATAPGYFPDAKAATTNTLTDFSITRDFAASSGGAKVVDFNGPDYSSFGCGPGGAIDLSTSTGWGSTTGDDNGDPTNVFVPKHITIDMGTPVDISSFGVDPTATCGDGGSASTAGYTIETSTDGMAFTPAAEGTFTSADRGKLNTVQPTGGASGVQFVRFTITSNQTPDFATNCPDGAFSGCSFTDLSEFAVFGADATP